MLRALKRGSQADQRFAHLLSRQRSKTNAEAGAGTTVERIVAGRVDGESLLSRSQRPCVNVDAGGRLAPYCDTPRGHGERNTLGEIGAQRPDHAVASALV